VTGRPRYPAYIPRAEEARIREQLAAVHSDGRSRAVLLYGSGGVGKTSLVRQMAEASTGQESIWLDPIDVDDPESWLLSNLERKVARRLDPGSTYFGPYQRELSRLPTYISSAISYETIVSYLGRIKEIFAQCYERYADGEKKTVVIVFDTVETIRGTNLLLTLTQWMKALPRATLFILSGRPPAHLGDRPDPIQAELGGPYHGIPLATILVDGFDYRGAHDFVDNSELSADLTEQEKDKLVLLTRGHPLWLAFMLDYLRGTGIPEEVEQWPTELIAQHLPYAAGMSPEGAQLHEAFLRRLVAPYQQSDFRHESIKRLAVVRQPIARVVWEQLMTGRQLPDDIASLSEAWDQLLETPWVRPRGNYQFVTLHDAVAEEFAQRLFPLHDENQEWRNGVWRRALQIYRGLTRRAEAELAPQAAALNEELRQFDTAGPGDTTASARAQDDLIKKSEALAARKRELGLLRAASLYYQFLVNFEVGSEEMLTYFRQAEQDHDVFLQDLLVLYAQRFLPGGTDADAFNDVVRVKLEEFRLWLRNDRPDYYIDLGVLVARHLIQAAQPATALDLLNRLPDDRATPSQRHRLNILRGNACMRIPTQVRDGLPYFARALAEAESMPSSDRHKFVAEAHKEYGYYFRNTGQWEEADLSYQRARDAISARLSARSPAADHDEMASIQTNWAYVKGLNGSYRDGTELAETAINVRHRRGQFADEGMSWSVCGEVHRYAGRYEKAWNAYAAAEQLLQGRQYWDRLGFVYQEQAICLYQAAQDDISLISDPVGAAKARITTALDICLAHSIRGYPSALNRAGRIFSQDEPDKALGYLKVGIAEAERLSDGWFWFANLIEYAELSYWLWDRTGQDHYRTAIADLADHVDRVAQLYSFPDLTGRWSLLHAHLATADYLKTGNESKLRAALEGYQAGFADIARKHVGSSGQASIAAEFATFRRIFFQLPEIVRADWQDALRQAWTAAGGDGSTMLLARLGELY
jgi:chloramphenicol 3-O-phosphotransferase